MSGRWDRRRLRAAARGILARGLAAADPARLVAEQLSLRGDVLHAAGARYRIGPGRLALVAAGKAAGRMARAAERALRHRLDEAIAVDSAATTRLARTALRLAGHPMPDRRGLAAAGEVAALAERLGRDDLLLLLLSGGASALLPAPAAGVSLEEKATTTALLLRSGATIHELNTVRKHLSRLKGGQLARLAAPARVIALVLSDVVGDDLGTIASGPVAPDPTTFSDALAVLARRGVLAATPSGVRRHLERGARGRLPETPKRGDPLFRRVHTRIVGSNRLTLAAAAAEARRRGLRPLVLTAHLEGEAREVARVLVAILRECAASGRPAAPPVCLLAGGETTVTVRGQGRGGRNQELAVAAAEPLARLGAPAVVASLASDGIDGNSDAAGGIADDRSIERAAALGLPPPAAFLAQSDSRSFLDALGDLIVTGPTGTNVVDVTLLACARRAGFDALRRGV